MSKKYELCQEHYVYIEDDNLIKRKLYRMGVIDDKALKNNQMRLVEDGSNARLYVESFVDNK